MISGNDNLEFITTYNQTPTEQNQYSEQYQQQNYYQQTTNQHQIVGEYASLIHGGFPGEPSLFEELGLHSADVIHNFRSILMPNHVHKPLQDNILANIFIFAAYSFLLLILNKPTFGLIYVMVISSVFLLYMLFGYMAKAFNPENNEVRVMTVITPMSYSIVPLFPMAAISRICGLSVFATAVISIPAIMYSSYCASKYMIPFLCGPTIELVFVPFALYFSYLLLLPLM